jgi:multidrug resistance efflux pump
LVDRSEGKRVGKRAALCAVAALSLLAVAWLASRGGAEPPQSATAAPARSVAPAAPGNASSVEVRRGSVTNQLAVDGELRAVRSRTIFADISEQGKITYLAPEGSIVEAGDRLVELDSSSILDRIKQVEESLVAAEGEIDQLKSSQEAALRDMEVELSKLWLAFEQAKVKARLPALILPRWEYQENQLAVEKTRTEYQNQVAKIAQKKKEQAAELQVKTIQREQFDTQLAQAQRNLDRMTVKAPAQAMVIYSEHYEERRKLQVGDIVWEGLALVMLPDLREMEVLAQVSEVDGPRVTLGQKATIVLDSYPDIEILGQVKEISQTAVRASWRAKTKIFYVVVAMDRTVVEIMKPGMSAQVTLDFPGRQDTLLVPRAAVVFGEKSPTVLRFEAGGAARPVAVNVLGSDARDYAVAANGALRAGDRIAPRGHQ